MKTVLVGSTRLNLEQIEGVARAQLKVKLSPGAKAKMMRSYRYLAGRVRSGETIYGVNTGFGLLSNVRISDQDIERLQLNLLRSHAVGTGESISVEASRAMLLLRAHALALGHSGVRPVVVETLLECLNRNVVPKIPEQGSVGASGDLAPLSHLALVLVGEGEAWFQGRLMKGRDALKKARIKPLSLGPKEGLALINGTQFMTALGALACKQAEYLAEIADLSAAMTTEALRGTETAFEKEIHAVRAHPGQVQSAQNLKRILTSGGKSEISKSHENCGKVQDPYSVRCAPQVHGATRDSLRFVREVLEREANSVTDNPLVFPESKKVLSGGNFHGQMVAIAMDLLSISVSELGSISEERIAKLVNPAISDLPAFLIEKGGLNSGFMIVQVAAAAIASENKTLCHPASVDSIPTSADKEDHVSMGAWAARKASSVVRNTGRILAMELMASAQGIDLLRPLKTSRVLEKAHSALRKEVSFLSEDRFLHRDLLKAEQLVLNRRIPLN